jgi:hypothetical protein
MLQSYISSTQIAFANLSTVVTDNTLACPFRLLELRLPRTSGLYIPLYDHGSIDHYIFSRDQDGS